MKRIIYIFIVFSGFIISSCSKFSDDLSIYTSPKDCWTVPIESTCKAGTVYVEMGILSGPPMLEVSNINGEGYIIEGADTLAKVTVNEPFQKTWNRSELYFASYNVCLFKGHNNTKLIFRAWNSNGKETYKTIYLKY